ncbi:MAG: pyridoxal 5'-phosphate synthase, partial [Steroidobacter sp.]
AKNDNPLTQKNAVCVSTIREDGFPSGRFVDLKVVDENGFKFCTQFDSNKGIEIAHNPKVAITVWWDHVNLQVRIIGGAERLSAEEATACWKTRTRDAQLATLCSNQSQQLDDECQFWERLEMVTRQHEKRDIPRPENWGGYVVRPISIEFLTFKESRLHVRELFELVAGRWRKQLLQP